MTIHPFPIRRDRPAFGLPALGVLLCFARALLNRLFLATALLLYAGATSALPISLVGSNVATGSTNSLIISAPTGMVVGDVMLVQIAQRQAKASISAGLAGWTIVERNSNAGTLAVEVWRKTAAATDLGASYNWPFAVAARTGMGIMAFREVDPVNSVDASAVSANPASPVYSAPSVVTTTVDAMVVTLFSIARSNALPDAPTGFTRAYFELGAAGPNGVTIAGFYALDSAPGPTGTATDPGNSSVVNTGVTVALRPRGPAYFSVVPASATASTCGTTTTTVTARASDNSVFTSFTGTLALSTSTGRGTWSLNAGSGAFTPGAADLGAASYTFTSADAGVARFNFANTHAQTLTQTATWSVATGTSTPVTFSLNSITITPSDPLGLQAVAGRPHAFTASFNRQDPATGICGVASGYAGAKPLDAWHSTTGSHPAGAVAPSYSNASNCSSPVALPSAAPAISAASSNVTTNFVAGVATFYLCTSDVGQYTLSLRDDTLSYADTAIAGSSGSITARPFGLWIDQVQSGATSNPGGTSAAGTRFVPAQSAFSARVSAKLWAAGQDTLVAGTPDATANLSGNASTPRFSATTTLTPSAHTPAAGVLGALSNGTLASGTFASGVSTPVNLSYSEAGSTRLTATSASYLGSGFNIPGIATGDLGRFHAASISQASATLGNACSAGGFSSMGQDFSVSTQLRALGSAGGVLTNYDASRGYAFLLAPTWRAVNSTDGVDLGSRLTTGASPAWTLGQWTFNNPTVRFARAAAGPDGPFDSLQLGLSGVDADLAAISSMDLSFTAAGTCTGAACNAKSVSAPTRARYGRLELQSAAGSILPTLRMQAQTMYWNSTGGAALGWTLNTLDSCSLIPYASMSVGAYAGSLASATLPSGTLAFTAGRATVVATRPGNSNVSGSAVVGVNLGSAASSPGGCSAGLPSVPGANLTHLQSSHCSAAGSFSANPAGKLVWGSSQGKSNSTIFQREVY